MYNEESQSEIAGWTSPSQLVFISILLGLWIFCHPYGGLQHDSRLYLAQALSHLQPEIFGHDLFFAYGSQDAYTFFSPVYAVAIQLLGVNHATKALLLFGHLFWVLGAFSIFRNLSDGITYRLALVLVFTMPAAFGGFGALSYGEPFLTPRLFAEALNLFAFGAVLRSRTLSSFMLLLISALFHPLVSLTGMAVVSFYLILVDKRWLLLPIMGGVLLLLLATAEVAPFARLFQTMDEQWLAVVHDRNLMVFPARWTSQDWSRLLFDAITVATGVFVLRGRERYFLGAVLLSSLCGVFVSFLGADIFNNVLVIQLQTWRAAGLLHLFSYFALALLATHLWDKAANRRVLYCLFFAAWFSIPYPAVSIGLSLLAATMTIADLRGRLPKLFEPIYYIAFFLAALAMVTDIFLSAITLYLRWELLGNPPFLRFILDFLRLAPILLAAGAVFFYYRQRGIVIHKGVSYVLAITLLVGACAVWDQRTEWDRYVESSGNRPASFQKKIPGSSTIYWEDDIKGAWLLLRRASYISAVQGGG